MHVRYVHTLAVNIAVISHSSRVCTMFSDRMHVSEWGKKCQNL